MAPGAANLIGRRLSGWAEGSFPLLTRLLRDGDLVVETPPRPPKAPQDWPWEMRTAVMLDGDVTIRVGEGGRKQEIRKAHAEATRAALAGLRREIGRLLLPGKVLLWVRVGTVLLTVPLASFGIALAVPENGGDRLVAFLHASWPQLAGSMAATEMLQCLNAITTPWARLRCLGRELWPAFVLYGIPWAFAFAGRLLQPYALRLAVRLLRRRFS